LKLKNQQYDKEQKYTKKVAEIRSEIFQEENKEFEKSLNAIQNLNGKTVDDTLIRIEKSITIAKDSLAKFGETLAKNILAFWTNWNENKGAYIRH